MKFKELQTFMDDCHDKDIVIPNGMTVVLDDYEENVPDDYREQGAVEYNHQHSDGFSTRMEIRSAKKIERGFELIRNQQ